jgi:hypothetical protein
MLQDINWLIDDQVDAWEYPFIAGYKCNNDLRQSDLYKDIFESRNGGLPNIANRFTTNTQKLTIEMGNFTIMAYLTGDDGNDLKLICRGIDILSISEKLNYVAEELNIKIWPTME